MFARWIQTGSRRLRLVVGLSTLAAFALLVVIAAAPVGAEPRGASFGLRADGTASAQAACITPTFENGLSQAVFPTGSANWINEQGWVEAPFDSDFDGDPDRIHFDVSRPVDTADPACNLKVPVIFEDSPYYANLGPSRNWAVDHEIGSPPATRAAEPYFNASNTAPTISTIYESTWVPRGYAVMHAESPGTGNSDGCPTSGAPNESLAAKAVIDWLNGRATAYTTRAGATTMTADWTTGKVGMMGTSYNGTIPIGAATTGVEGLEAIIPISAISNWYDYYRANGAVRAPYTFQGEDLDVLEDAVYSRNDEPAPQRLICQDYIRNVTQNGIDRATGDYNAFWDDRNYMKDIDNVHAAALVAHGNMDLNVMTKNMRQFYDALKENNVPHMLYFHRGGHGGSPPDALMNRWFTKYLYGVENGIDAAPRAWVVREANACPPRTATVDVDQSNVSTLTVTSTAGLSWGTLTVPQLNSSGTTTNTTRVIQSIPDSTHVVLATAVATAAGQKVAAGATVSQDCSTANPTPYAEWPDPGAADAKVNFTAGNPGAGGLTFQPGSAANETLTDAPTTTMLNLVNSTTSGSRLLYKSPVLTQNVRISGTVHVSLMLSFSKPRANLTAVLVDLPATGTLTNGTFQERSTRGWLDPENRGGNPAVSEPIVPGQFYRMYFDMQAKDLVALAGRRLGVMVVSSDQEASIRPAAGTQLTMDLSQSWAEIPVVGGPPALAQAFGVVPPTVAYTLDPPDPNGPNGWYTTGSIALAWQTTDGGAETTKTGCADETFSTDGVFARSCTATNAAGTAGPVSVTVKRDTTAPAITANVSGTPGLGGYRPANPTVTLNAVDATSGIALTEYSLDGAAFQTYTGGFLVTGDGAHTVDFRTTDNAGWSSPTGSTSFLVDANAPTTTPSVDPPAVGGFHRTPKVTLAASDGTGIGVAGVQYTVDGSGTRSYTAPFWVTGDGVHTVTYRAVDMLGKIEATKTITFTVDGSPPMSSVKLTPAPVGGLYVNPTLTISSNDFVGGSGIASIEYLLDSGGWTTYSGPFAVPGDGSHTIQFHATDNAGNVEAVKTKSFTVDATGPVISISSPAGTYTLNQFVSPSYSCSDAGAGVASCSGPPGIDTSSIGTKSYVVDASDLVGNTSSLTRTYNVVWPFTGFSVPSSAKAGSQVKVKFSLGGNRGSAIVSSQGSATVNCTTRVDPGAYPPVAGESYSTPSYSGGSYTINWQSVSGWKNTCRIYSLTLADGTTHTAVVRFT